MFCTKSRCGTIRVRILDPSGLVEETRTTRREEGSNMVLALADEPLLDSQSRSFTYRVTDGETFHPFLVG